MSVSTRLAGVVIALLASLALVAGCGGGDSSEAASTETPATVTVTTAAPTTEPVETTASEPPAETPAETPADQPSIGDVDPEGMEAVIAMYKESLGFSDAEARCVLDKAMKLEDVGDLSGPSPDMGALMGSGIMTVFTDCGIDLNTLIERMSQAG